MWSHELASGIAGMILSLIAPLAQTALVAPSYGALDCGIWISQAGITAGTSAQLTWWSMNATSAALGEGANPLSPVALSSTITVTPASSRTYTLQVRDAQGASKTCSVSVNVTPSTSGAPTCSLSTAPGTHYTGQAVRLVWYSQNALSGTLSASGALAQNELASGYRDVYPNQSTLYTLQVGNGSGSQTCSTLVTIASGGGTSYTYPSQTSYSYSYPPYTSYTQAPSVYYSNAVYSSPTVQQSYVVSSGWYPNPVNYATPYYSSSYSTYPSSAGYSVWDNPSYQNGLGDYTLTSVWNDVGSGAYFSASQDCGGYSCDDPYAWSYGSDTFSQYGGYDSYGYVNNIRYDNYGHVTGSAYEETPYPDSFYNSGSYYGGSSGSYTPGTSLDYSGSYYGDSSAASSPFDYYPSSAYDSYNSSYQYQGASDPAWYSYDPSGWNGGSDPYQSGVDYGGSLQGSWDYQI